MKTTPNNPDIPKTPFPPVEIPKIRVENMTGSTYAKVANQFIIRTDNGTYFQSYRTIIVARVGGQTYLDAEMWDYSTTTGKYRNKFLGETKAETQKKINSGEYILTDLTISDNLATIPQPTIHKIDLNLI